MGVKFVQEPKNEQSKMVMKLAKRNSSVETGAKTTEFQTEIKTPKKAEVLF